MPKEVVNYANLLTAKYPKSHLSIGHGLITTDPIELWEILEGMTVQTIKKFRGKDKIIIFRKKTIEKKREFRPKIYQENCVILRRKKS